MLILAPRKRKKPLQEYLQQTNTDDSGKVGFGGGISCFGKINAKIYTGNMNEELFYRT